MNKLDPLSVIQVSHHGGANAYFYRVLLEASARVDLNNAYLLLSHETRSKYRPSNELRLFLQSVRNSDSGPALLFTSQPKSENVTDYKDLFHPVVGTEADAGDVRLTFASGTWDVEKHAVRAP